MAAQMREPHPARVVEMRKRAFDPFAALAHQAAAAAAPHPATIARHRRLGLGSLRPITSPPVRLGHVGPDAHGVQVDQGLIAVIPLITDDLVQSLRTSTLACASSTCDGDGGLDDRRGVADISAVQCHRDNRTGLHVDGMLGFVRQMRTAIFRSTFASGSWGCVQSVFRSFGLVCARASRVGVSPSRDPPETPGSSVVSRRTMLRTAFASSVVASIAMVLPVSRPASTSRCCTHVKTVRLQIDQAPRAAIVE